MTTSVNCPNCNKKVVWQTASEFRPFCSERCRLQDLGAWFTEEHKISEESVDDLDELMLSPGNKTDEPVNIN